MAPIPTVPVAITAGGTLYGTTVFGGSAGDGTVFKEKQTSGVWSETTLYNFAGATGDGNGPFAGVLLTAESCTAPRFTAAATPTKGAAYSLTPSGNTWIEAVLYNFGASGSDGTNPHPALVAASSTRFYGTTDNGGANGCGTVYQLQNSGGTWTETVLYSFACGRDGSNPHSSLIINGRGSLYGSV